HCQDLVPAGRRIRHRRRGGHRLGPVRARFQPVMRRVNTGLLLFLAAAACSSGPPRPPMSEGERTYCAKCTSCHRVYEPHDQTAEQWVRTLDKMEALKK